MQRSFIVNMVHQNVFEVQNFTLLEADNFCTFYCVYSGGGLNKNSNKFLYSSISSPYNCSNFKMLNTLLSGRPIQSNTISTSLKLSGNKSAIQQLIHKFVYKYTPLSITRYSCSQLGEL